MKVYLSARYARMDELKLYRAELERHGIKCTARWLDGGTFENSAANAQIDLDDVDAADVLVNFSEEPVEHSPHAFASRGGRHVELGYALGKGKTVIVVGPRENVFHYGHGVAHCVTWQDAYWLLRDRALARKSDPGPRMAALRDAGEAAIAEARRAASIHKPFNSAHEGWAVLLEELDELWDEVRKRVHDPEAMRKEAIQVAAMGLRFVTDVCR